MLGGIDALVLIPADNEYKKGRQELYPDPNLAALMQCIVTREAAEPHSLHKPLVVDNRGQRFSKALQVVLSNYTNGAKMGDLPFFIANTDEEMKQILKEIRNEVQRAPQIKRPEEAQQALKKPSEIPDDGKFTLFIGGGHANNNKRDREDAFNLGYHCAQKDWRIVTGAGSVEGSMGSVHTGFIQYHLDKLLYPELWETPDSDLDKTRREFIKKLDALKDPKTHNTGSYTKEVNHRTVYDAEKIIYDHPEIIDAMADAKPPLIPRGMFYGYSLKNLLKLESPSGKSPPGITYSETGNLPRRMQALLAPGTKVIMSGSIGTDQEIMEAIHQHVHVRTQKGTFKDGTPNDNGMLVIYNINGKYDAILGKYGMKGESPLAADKREKNNIIVVDTYEKLLNVLSGDPEQKKHTGEKVQSRKMGRAETYRMEREEADAAMRRGR